MIRNHSARWHVYAKRIGMLGFSAGAMTSLATALADDAGARPDFLALIYGSMTAVTPPPSLQPLSVALASHDPLFNQQGFGLIESRPRAGGSVELHYYEAGRHGFGSRTVHHTSDLWFAQLVAWMEARGLLKSARAEGATP